MDNFIALGAKLVETGQMYIVKEYLAVDGDALDSNHHEPVFATVGAARAYADKACSHSGKIKWNDDGEYLPGQFGMFRIEDKNGVVQWEYVIKAVSVYEEGNDDE